MLVILEANTVVWKATNTDIAGCSFDQSSASSLLLPNQNTCRANFATLVSSDCWWRMSSTGGKRVVRSSRKKNDRISYLPDDILISILTLLRMEEAARTSLLSRRWRYLWTFTWRLDFWRPELQFLEYGRLQRQKLEFEMCRFVEWVNQVLKLHKAPVVDVLRIAFHMDDERYKSDIDSWLKFAFLKKAQWLQLNFYDSFGLSDMPNYTLTSQFLQNYKLDYLQQLYLNHVDLTGEVIGYLLSKCLFLKALSVKCARSLVNLKVNGPLLRLEHLEIVNCCKLKSVEIFSLNLVSFKFEGLEFSTAISFKDVPSLVDVYYNGINPACIFCIRSQLKKLFIVENLKRLPKFPTLKNLKDLELHLFETRATSLLCLMPLLKACPALHELRLYFVILGEVVKRRKKTTKPSHEGRHECLKVFKLGGFVGYKIDKELLWNVVNYAVSLEKIVIAPRCPRDDATRARARQLITRLPPGVELVVL